MLVGLLLVYTLFFTVLIGTCYLPRMVQYHTPVKLVCSLGFLSVAIAGVLTGGDRTYFFSLLPAFLFCLIGDVLLALCDRRQGEGLFLGGLGAFLVGHILFVAAFHRLQALTWVDFIFPVVMVGVTYLVTRMKGMKLDKMLPYVLIYAFFVSLLFSKAMMIGLLDGFSFRNSLLCVGSLLFLLSDVIILFIYFYERKFAISRFVNLLTYYYGLFLLAYSVFAS